MSDATIRAAIKARLDALSGIGRVHDYERWATNRGAILSFFQDPTTKKIFGWEIVRQRFRIARSGMNKYRLVHGFMLRGYYALEDAAATEKTVNAIVDQIVLDFGLTKITGTQGDQLPKGTIGVRFFGNIMCHVAEIELADIAENITEEEAGELLTGIDLDYYLQPDDGERDGYDTLDFNEEV